MNILLGSHINFESKTGLLGATKKAIEIGANSFMVYTGAPQNTKRAKIDVAITKKAHFLMKKNNINQENIFVHAPYIINLANKKDLEKYTFSINFIKEELNRTKELGIKYIVLHPGNHLGEGIEEGSKNIIEALNKIINDTKETVILLETMAGKGTEIGSSFNEIKEIIAKIENKTRIGVCMDTCHMNDAGYDIKNFDQLLIEFENIVGLKYLKCIHTNDTMNEKGAKKDRHQNIGFGKLGFETMINVIYNEKTKDIPKILETPYISKIEGEKDKVLAPYKEEIQMIKNKVFDQKLYEKIRNSI